MPSSYRDPDERDGDRIVYFDYAKSLENRRRPLPWRDLSRAMICSSILLFAYGSLARSSLVYGLFLAVLGAVHGLSIIPLIRVGRALSAKNIVTLERPKK
jgi:hypothetical protein